MNTKSIRFKLTFIYSSVLILSAAILFASFYWVTQRELYSHTDTTLRSHAERFRDLFITEESANPNMSPVILDEIKEIPGMLGIVTDNEGTVIFTSQPIANSNLINKLFSLHKQQNGEVIIDYPIGSLAMRFIVLPATLNNQGAGVVIMGHPIDVIESSLRSLTTSLTLVFLSLIIPTVFGGYVLSGSALKPIGEIGNEMEALSVENLKKRVKNPGTGDEVETLATAFNRLLDRLESAFGRERQFIGDVAHEMKTPLSTVRGSIDVALSRPRTNDEYKKLLQNLSIDTERLSQTLTNILDLAWSQTDASQNLLEPVSLTEIGRELLEIGQKLSFDKQIAIHAHIEEGVTARGKKDKLFRSLLNFVENAIKYTGKKGKVTLTIKKSDTESVVIIKDTGEGIPVEDLPHIFDRFYRGSKADKTLGSGLGLSIAHGIITSMGGHITTVSMVGKGTTFRIMFPRS